MRQKNKKHLTRALLAFLLAGGIIQNEGFTHIYAPLEESLSRSSQRVGGERGQTMPFRTKQSAFLPSSGAVPTKEYGSYSKIRLMSSIPGDDDNQHGSTDISSVIAALEKAIQELISKFKKLPPYPENFLVLGGDVAALFMYSFLDHSLNSLYISTMAKTSAEEIIGIHAAWLDAFHMPASFLASQMPPPVTYAPALDSAGICSVLFTTCWLLSGYFNEAFSYQNTVLCDTTRAIMVAGKTWIFAACAMAAIAFFSDQCGCDLQYQVGGLTRADTDAIMADHSL